MKKPPEADHSSPKFTFVALFSDGVVTRMTTHCENGKLNLGRGLALSVAAYESRAGKTPPPIVVANGQALAYAYFEEEPGRRAVKHPHPDVAFASELRTALLVQIDWFDFIRSTGEYQCPTRSKLRPSESAASMQYRC
jgi:hypothetical protein